ncbi:PAC2 family protein [Corynebacterium sp. HS2168-gen11]|uniref:PAC2 family protein n=1 Tax=Corynebacterium sp. HS2168-gen11 TaxID=2974027 RepID=UPI0037BE3779
MEYPHNRMYDLEYPTPEIGSTHDTGVSLIIALQGYADAGQAVTLASEHLQAALDHRVIANFHSDELIDYRSRRPLVTIDQNSIADFERLGLTMHVMHDAKERPFLLLSGPEPDLRWDAFSNVIVELIERFHVTQTICLYSAPMAVPHTRPMIVSAHGNIAEILQTYHTLDSKFQIPGAVSLLIEKKLQDKHLPFAGITAHVPHYVATTSYPLATLRLLSSVEETAGISIPLESLEQDIDNVAKQIQEQVGQSAEIGSVVELLEQQYDESLEQLEQARREQKALESDDKDPKHMPSGEELGEEFERFLADLHDETNTDPQYAVASEDSPADDTDKASDDTARDARHEHDSTPPAAHKHDSESTHPQDSSPNDEQS